VTTLIDKFGRSIDYIRLSVTDRCDFRCVYCMAEDMTFLPRKDILSLEELNRVARLFVELGVKRIRLTGGEPLVRNDVMSMISNIGTLEGLDELTLTTNGAQLTRFALPLREAGVKRINISLDSLQADRFKSLTRTGELSKVLAGIQAARDAGFERIKLNAVIMRGRNDDEILPLLDYCRDNNLDISYIEEMPLGQIDEHDRAISFFPSDDIRNLIDQHYPLKASDAQTGGPSVYYTMADSDSRVGFISPHSHNFCHLCNRVRVTVEGRLLLCLGNEHSVNLMPLLRDGASDDDIKSAIVAALDLKPEKHHFSLDDEPQILRFMNMTGG
jgi:cyclic pyranopterin phosphate synthase